MSVPATGWADVATKRDLDQLRAMTKTDLDLLRADMERSIERAGADLHKTISTHTVAIVFAAVLAAGQLH